MASENKTRQNDGDVGAFLGSVENEQRRADGFAVLQLMQEVTGDEPRMWGDAIVGFGSVHYRYASGREGDMPVVGFSPRKQNLTLYLAFDYDGFDELSRRLGKHKLSKACLYLNKLSDVDLTVLREMVRRSAEHSLSRPQP
ncbi:DUF1801 domain-containing protein [Gordonia sp. (in: high G+C Gram-positive bacteria)]|uniref:DUF1801 domain-containing protein n=1 Tax=Gordonia sp. (in: high G+C Gram-positive bacteria) TaxID=84139 RepID=UPI0016B73408|nr:DUF1801 domain-containing protein [Gordonia sp. (in: high G+C Gram-positive bacteria)]NLG46300.1 DUF1801 domain-containing protein [Gordonia sp. (in: high G+C Gram-positive bacteria)]